MTDLFNHDHHQDEAALGEAMARHHQEHDLPIIRERGVIPDWRGEPEPLSKDKARILTYLYENGYFSWTARTSRNNKQMVDVMQLGTQAYAKSVIDDLLEFEMIETRLYNGEEVFQMTQVGETAMGAYELALEAYELSLDAYEVDKELGIL